MKNKNIILKIKILKSKIESWKRKYGNLEKQKDDLRDEVAKLKQRKIKDDKDNVHRQTMEVENLKKQLGILKKGREKSYDIKSDKKSQKSEDQDKHNEELRKLQDIIDTMEKRIQASGLDERVDKTLDENEIQKKNIALEDEIKDLKKMIDDKDIELIENNEKNNEYENEIKRLKDYIKELEEKIRKLEAENKRLNEIIKKKDEEIAEW